MLIVITIIAILAALVLRTSGGTHRISVENRVKAEISALSAALESYKADNGDYPTGTNLRTDASGANAFLLAAFLPASGKVYFEPAKGQTNSGRNLIDPFGNAYGYTYPGDPNRSGTNSFDLWSVGVSGSNSAGWIKNW